MRIEIDGEIGTLTLDRPRRLQRDEPGDDRRDDDRLRLARRPGPAAGADRDRRRQGLLLRRRRQLVQRGSRVGGDRPASQVRRGAEALHTAIIDLRRIPYPVIAAVNGPGRGRRLLAGARLRHPHRLRVGLLRLRLRPHRRLAGRRHDLLPAPRGRAEPGAGDPSQRSQHERRRRTGREDRRPRSWHPRN